MTLESKDAVHAICDSRSSSAARPSAVDRRPSIKAGRDSRVCADADPLLATGCFVAGVGSYRHGFVNPQKGPTSTKCSSNSTVSPRPREGLGWNTVPPPLTQRAGQHFSIVSAHHEVNMFCGRRGGWQSGSSVVVFSPLMRLSEAQRKRCEHFFDLVYECSVNRSAAKAPINRILLQLK